MLIQDESLAVRELKVAFFIKEETEADVSIKGRWLEEETLGKGDGLQYKLPQFKIP